MKDLWLYSLLRAALLLVTYLVLWCVAQLFWNVPAPWDLSKPESILVLFAAVVVSSIAALVTLGSQRDRLAQGIARRAEKMQAKFEEAKRAEDVD